MAANADLERVLVIDDRDTPLTLACLLYTSIPGVIDAESGYANGTCEADADYKTVCKGETGFREAVPNFYWRKR